MKKRMVCVFLLLSILIGYVPSAVAVEKNSIEDTEIRDSITVTNPLYSDWSEVTVESSQNSAALTQISTSVHQLANKNSGTIDSENAYTQIADAAAFVRSQMTNRQTSIALSYLNVSSEDEKIDIAQGIFDEAIAETGAGNQGDYLRWQYGRYSCDIQGYWYANDDGTRTYQYKLLYTFVYNTTAAQEQTLNSKLNSVLESLDLDEATDYQKVRRIYEYICDNVSYDTAAENDSTKGKYTAYNALVEGKAVCQGYAVLLYRMLREEGISARVIGGIAEESGEEHSWNIVRMGDKYYYLDTTWDAGKSHDAYDYFLRGIDGFLGHAAGDEYTTTAFQNAYPIAQHTYEPSAADRGEDGILGQGFCGESVIWSLIEDGTLTLRGSGAMDDYGADEAPWSSFRDRITAIDVGDGITAIGANSFQGCTALAAAVVLPSSVTKIGASAFAGDTALPSVDVMPNVTKISKIAFSNCGSDFVLRGCTGSTAESIAASAGLTFQAVQDIANTTVYLSQYSYTYTGEACTPYAIAVATDGTEVTEYSISYENNVNAGIGYARLSGAGEYGGRISEPITIEKAVPEVAAPAGLSALCGQSLQAIQLGCRYAWNDPAQSVGTQAGVQTFSMTYTPEDTDNYEIVTDLSADVTVCDTIGLSYTQADTFVGAELHIIAAALSREGAADLITWSSSNTNVAKISSTGAVTAAAQGTAVITAKSDNGEYAQCTVTVAQLPFVDVSSSAWYYNAVSFAYGMDVFAGTRADTFAPSAAMTRAMAVQVLYNMEGQPAVASSSTFSDVPAGKWYTNAVIWASENDVVSGVGHGKFAPDTNVTRQQIAQILYNYAKKQQYWTVGFADLSSFDDDAKVASWAEEAMQWAVANELISGTNKNLLNPTLSATRAEVAQILMKFQYNIMFG